MEADALGDAYVPPARFVSLLKRLEARRGAGGEAGAEASGERSHGAAQRTPSPADFDRYTVAVRTAPARTPALARNRGGGGSTLTADADGELDLSKLAGDAKGEVTHLALLRHDHAVEAYGERRAVVDAALTAQRRMDFYVTTAEADARRRNEQDPQAAPGGSNYEAIAEKLGLARTRNDSGYHDDDDNDEAPHGPTTGPGSSTVATPSLPNFAAVPSDAAVASPPSIRKTGSGLTKLQKTASKLRIAAALSGSTNSNSVRVGAIEPQEFANLRSRLAENEVAMAEMKSDFERRLQEAALRADLESRALRVEAEERADALTEQLTAARSDAKRARDQTEQALQEVQRVSGFEREAERLGLQLEHERTARRELDATIVDLRREADMLPIRVEERTASIVTEKAVVEQAKIDLERDLEAASAIVAERDEQLQALQAELTEARDASARADAARLDEAAARERAERARLEACAELESLGSQKAGFENQARAKMCKEIDDAHAQAKMKSEAYEAVFREKATAEAEAARLKEIADAFDVQRKTLKRATRDLSHARDEIRDLRDANAKAMERRMHHIFTNIALKLSLARVLRPNGLQDRLNAAEQQNAWLFARLAEATAMAKKRLQPNKAPPVRLVQRLPDEEAAIAAAAAAEATRGLEEAERDAAEAAAAAATWVIDSAVQTEDVAYSSATAAEAGEAIAQPPRSHRASLDAETARRSAVAAHRASAVSHSQIATSSGPGRLTERGLKLAAAEALRSVVSPKEAPEQRNDGSIEGRDATRTRDMRSGVPRPLSAASHSNASAARVRRRQADGMPRRATSATASHTRPSSALSTASAASANAEPPAPNLLVVGTQGPLAGSLASNPYNFFGRTGAAAPPPATNHTWSPTDGWVPTHYAVGSLPPASACGSTFYQHGAGGGAEWRPPSTTSAAASARQHHERGPASHFPFALTAEGAYDEDVTHRRSDDPDGARVAGVTPMSVAAPAPKLPGGAWARGQGAQPPAHR